MLAQSLVSFLQARTERYGGAVNGHDWIKFIAIIIMTIDHIGFFFAPDQIWYRVVGHWGFPIWFFLAGYARAGAFPRSFIVLAVLMAAINPAAAFPVFPLNAIFSIMICRYIVQVLDRYRDWMFKNLIEIAALLVILIPFTDLIFEYGTLAILCALMGYMRRTEAPKRLYDWYVLGLFVIYMAWQIDHFRFDELEAIGAFLGTAVCFYVLYDFKREGAFPALRDGFAAGMVKFLSRNSLYYYFAHRVAFQIVFALWLLPPGIERLRWF